MESTYIETYKNTFNIQKTDEFSNIKKFSKNGNRITYIDNLGIITTIKDSRFMSFIEKYDNFIISRDGNVLVCLVHIDGKLKLKILIFSEDYFREVYLDVYRQYSVRISKNGDLIYVQNCGEIIFISKEGVLLFNIIDEDIHPFKETNFSDDENTFYYETDEYIKIFDLKTMQFKKEIKMENYIDSIFLEENTITYSRKNNIFVYCLLEDKILRTEKYDCERIGNLKYSPNKFFITFIDGFKHPFTLKIYCKKYGFMGDVHLSGQYSGESVQVTNNELSFLGVYNLSFVVFDLYSLFNLYSKFKSDYIFLFLKSLTEKESTAFNFGNNDLSDVKNLTPLIFSYL